jgi:hypothetical protein
MALVLAALGGAALTLPASDAAAADECPGQSKQALAFVRYTDIFVFRPGELGGATTGNIERTFVSLP